MHSELARTSRWLAVPVSLLALASIAAVPLHGRFGFGAPDLSGTWPNIGISVTTVNGWVVAQGRTEDMTQAVVWQTPLAPANGPVVVEQGYGSAYVQVGARRFVIDAATGRTAELGPGQVLRQPWPWGAPAPGPVPNPPPSEGLTVRPAPPPAAPAPADAKQAAIAQLANENLSLSLALRRLDEIYALVAAKKATDADLKAAQKAVADARKAVALAQANALNIIAPELAAQKPKPAAPPTTTRPAVAQAPPAPPEVRDAQARVLDLMAQRINAQNELNRLRTQWPADDKVIRDAEAKVEAISAQLDQADQQLRKLRLVDSLPPADRSNPKIEAEISKAAREVQARQEEHELAEKQLLRVQAAYAKGLADKDELAAAQAKLLDTLKNLSDAKADLECLTQTAATAGK